METTQTFMLQNTTHLLQYFASSAVTFATADNSIAATGIGSGITAGDEVVVASAAQSGNNTTFTVVTSAADKLVVTPTVTAESAGASVTINEQISLPWREIEAFVKLTGTINASQNCTVYVDQSQDGVTLDYADSVSVTGGTAAAWSKEVVARFGRLRIKNGGTDQTTLRATLNGRSLT